MPNETKQLGRLGSAVVYGSTLFASIALLSVGFGWVPIAGHLFKIVVLLGSPFLWLHLLFLRSRDEGVTLERALIHRPLYFMLFVFGPLLVYGIALGLVLPLKSRRLARIAKSVAVRFLLTLLALCLISTWIAMYLF